MVIFTYIVKITMTFQYDKIFSRGDTKHEN
jgi:hypothetical protein